MGAGPEVVDLTKGRRLIALALLNQGNIDYTGQMDGLARFQGIVLAVLCLAAQGCGCRSNSNSVEPVTASLMIPKLNWRSEERRVGKECCR